MIEALPKGWVKTALGEIIQVNSGDGLTKKQMVPDGKVPVYGGNGITGFHNKGNINKETIVIGRVGYYCGSVHLTAENAWVTDNAFITRFSENNIDKKFLFYLLISTDLRINDSSTAQPVISGNKIYPIEILIPPLQEQKRIAKKLDCLLDKVNACKARLGKVPEIIKRFRQSVLADAVSGKLTEDCREKPDSTKWRNKQLKEVVNFIDGDRGKNYPKRREFSNNNGYCLFLSTKNVREGTWNFSDLLFITKGKDGVLRKGKIERGDIVLTTRGTIGNVALYDNKISYERIRINSGMLIARSSLTNLDEQYLLLYFLSPHFRYQVERRQTGSAQPQLPIKILSRFNIKIPPLDEQREIVRRVHSLFLVADQLDAKLKAAKSRTDQLTASILSIAFSGRLVPQDPNEEPAEELLKRIGVERVNLVANKKNSKRMPKKRSGREKKTEPQNADTEPEPAEVQVKIDSDEEKDRRVKSRKQPVAQIDKRFKGTDVLQAFRKAVFRQTGIDEYTLLRLVGQRLGVMRLSTQIRQELESYIKTAIRRKIIVRDGDSYNSATPTIHHYDDDYLIKVLRSVVRKGYEYEREHLVAEAAEYLGFAKVSDAFTERMKSVFRLAIRTGELYRNGIYVGRP